MGLDSTSGTNVKTIWAGDEITPTFYITQEGQLYAENAEIHGMIEASTGHILGRLGIGAVDSYSYISVLGIDPVALKIGDYFTVTHDGTLTSQNATIVGNISANVGYLGGTDGWTIATQLLYSNNLKNAFYSGTTEYLVEEDIGHSPARIWVGGFNDETPIETPFFSYRLWHTLC